MQCLAGSVDERLASVDARLASVDGRLAELTASSKAANARGADVQKLQNTLVALGYQLPTHETAGQIFGAATANALRHFQRSHGLPDDGVLDRATHDALSEASSSASGSSKRLEGRVYLEDGRPAVGVGLTFHQLQPNGTCLLLGSFTTVTGGFYAFDFAATVIDVQVRATVAAPPPADVVLSKAVFLTGKYTELNLVAPLTTLAATTEGSELDRLNAVLSAQGIGTGIDGLTGKREDETVQELTLLSKKTGWDARLIEGREHPGQQPNPTQLRTASSRHIGAQLRPIAVRPSTQRLIV